MGRFVIFNEDDGISAVGEWVKKENPARDRVLKRFVKSQFHV
jgi:hypothetical protein